MGSPTKRTDDLLVEALCVCNDYAEAQESLAKHMSDGMFQLAVARKQGALLTTSLSAENIRLDFDAVATVRVCVEEEEEEKKTSFALQRDKDADDPLLLLSGLPPRALKISQKHFAGAVKIVLQLAASRLQLQRLIDLDQKA